MKIIDAFWEKRNLGTDCTEIVIDINDFPADVIQKFESIQEKSYNVIKIPSTQNIIADYFQSKGYKFIETAISMTNNMKKISVPDKLKRILDKCAYSIMDSSDIENMKSEIKKGIFRTDRISLDPFFSIEKSAQRYIMWIDDLISQGNIPNKVIFNNTVIGFFLNKKTENNIYDGILAGVYKDFEGSGMGYCIQYQGLVSALNNNAKKYLGHISSNNPEVFKILISLGFEIQKLEYVFIKHNNV